MADVSIVDVSCRWAAGARMLERFQTFGLSLVRRGLFVRHRRQVDQIGDSTTAYFEQPGFEQSVSHPLSVPGTTTVVVLADEAMARYAGDVWMPDRPIPVSPDVHLDHAALLTDVRSGIDSAELDARLAWMIGRLVETSAPGRLTSRRTDTVKAHHRIVHYAREAIAANPGSFSLPRLAADLGHSPFHVSRIFRRATGTTLTQHRNQVRVAVAIDRISQGQHLADVAAELGFFDQSHLARALRRTVRVPPGRIRHRLFKEGRPSAKLDNDVQDRAVRARVT
jgi:AraC-like DNA-binding protein